MKSITFPEVNQKIAEDQEEYETVYANTRTDEIGVSVITVCFELTDAEAEEIFLNKKIWYQQIVSRNRMHPMNLSITKPEL